MSQRLEMPQLGYPLLALGLALLLAACLVRADGPVQEAAEPKEKIVPGSHEEHKELEAPPTPKPEARVEPIEPESPEGPKGLKGPEAHSLRNVCSHIQFHTGGEYSSVFAAEEIEESKKAACKDCCKKAGKKYGYLTYAPLRVCECTSDRARRFYGRFF